jgi:hypothetical protein
MFKEMLVYLTLLKIKQNQMLAVKTCHCITDKDADAGFNQTGTKESY